MRSPWQVREINKYTLQDDGASADDVPRIGLYILQDEVWSTAPSPPSFPQA